MKTTTRNQLAFRLILALTVSIPFMVSSCKKQAPAEKENSLLPELALDQLEVQLDSLDKNMVIAWDSMTKSDDLKMRYLLRFIDEISYIPGSDSKGVDSLRALHKQIKDLKFDRFTLTNELTDRYDSMQTKLIKKVYALGLKTPNIDAYPLVDELTEDIDLLDVQLIQNRDNYDEFSIPYNCILDNYSNQVQTLKPKYKNMKKVFIFMLEPNCFPSKEDTEEIDPDSMDWES